MSDKILHFNLPQRLMAEMRQAISAFDVQRITAIYYQMFPNEKPDAQDSAGRRVPPELEQSLAGETSSLEADHTAPSLRNERPAEAIAWTEEELSSFKRLASEPQPGPTSHPVRAMSNSAILTSGQDSQETRFADFDDETHPANQWWKKHGQFMMSGGGRTQFIWACRGWIAREQLMCGAEVTGESLHERHDGAEPLTSGQPQQPPKHDIKILWAEWVNTLPLCSTTSTPRFPLADCKCGTYKENLGPCLEYEIGMGGKCPYCAHAKECHRWAFVAWGEWLAARIEAEPTSGPQQEPPPLRDVRNILLAIYELCAVRPKGTGPEVSRECVFCEAREDVNGKVNHYLSCHADRGKRLAEKLAATTGPASQSARFYDRLQGLLISEKLQNLDESALTEVRDYLSNVLESLNIALDPTAQATLAHLARQISAPTPASGAAQGESLIATTNASNNSRTLCTSEALSEGNYPIVANQTAPVTPVQSAEQLFDAMQSTGWMMPEEWKKAAVYFAEKYHVQTSVPPVPHCPRCGSFQILLNYNLWTADGKRSVHWARCQACEHGTNLNSTPAEFNEFFSPALPGKEPGIKEKVAGWPSECIHGKRIDENSWCDECRNSSLGGRKEGEPMPTELELDSILKRKPNGGLE